MTLMRAIVADDEPLAVRRLIDALVKSGKAELVGSAKDGAEAVALIRSERPDLAVLDIAMPAVSGIDVVEAIDLAHPPAFIFVSAHRQYALEAFQTGAVDYLLKPLDRERFAKALDRARQALVSRTAQQRIEELGAPIEALRSEEARRSAKVANRSFWTNSKARLTRIPLDDVLWFGSDGDYVRLHTDEREHLIHESLRNLEQTLNPRQFVRVHRQAIVRTAAVSAIERLAFGAMRAVLLNGDVVPIGRSYRGALQAIMADLPAAESSPRSAHD